jgi:hypothetical protein
MVGVAKEVSDQERRRKGPTWTGTIGILNDVEIGQLIDSLHSLIDIEESLYFLIHKSESIEFTLPRTSKQKPVKQ